MKSPPTPTLLRSSKASMITLPAVLVIVTSYLKSTLVSDRGVSRPHCFSTFLWHWIMRRTTEGHDQGHHSHGHWPFSYLKDLDYTDDPTPHIQEKTQRLNTFAKQVGLNISNKKTKIMARNTTNTWPVQIYNEELPYTNRFTYRGSIISRDGGTDKVRNSLGMINRYGVHSFTVLVQSLNSDTAAPSQLSCMVKSVGA